MNVLFSSYLSPWLKQQWQWSKQKIHFLRTRQPSVGSVDFGTLRRVKPISRQFGFDRGLPIDRYYIEQFLSCHQDDIRGHVLEVAIATYTKRFGGDQVHTSDVLHYPIGVISPAVTIVADLTDAKHIAENTFDCIILTQTLLFIYDLKAAIQTLHRILKPGGVILVTVPGISQIIREDMEIWGEYWRFTRQSIQRIFSEIFIPNSIQVKTYGNVLSATSFLFGLSCTEL